MTYATNLSQVGSNNTTFRNRIINGAMMIDQRNAGASVTNNTSWQYAVDRWAIYGSVSSKFTAQQSSTAPSGFVNSWLVTSSSAYSVSSGDQFILKQTIEGFNTADLGFGTASASPVTLSFWVRSSLTGTFSGALKNGTGSPRSYVFSYTINSANTWEYKTITIAGDTSGAYLTNNGAGLILWMDLGSGSTYRTTAGSWVAGDYEGATGSVSLVGTSGATFYITGVQLEAGTAASPFEYRQYGTELALCQRYYYKNVTTVANTNIFGSGYNDSTTRTIVYMALPVTMRSNPTLNFSAANTFYWIAASSPSACTSVTAHKTGVNGVAINFFTSAGLVAGQGVLIMDNNSASAYIDASSEL